MIIHTVEVSGTFDPSVDSSFSIQTLILIGEGKIQKTNNYEIVIDHLYVKTTNFQSTEQLRPFNVHVSKSALTKLSLKTNDPVHFHVNYSVCSIPYVEVEMSDGAAPKGHLVLDNVDDTTEHIFARVNETDIVVDILCAQDINCDDWTYEFTQKNSTQSTNASTESLHNMEDYFAVDCRKGTYNSAMMCLSLVNKSVPLPKESLKGWEIALIVIAAIIAAGLIVVVSIYIAGKVKRYYERKILYQGLENDFNQCDSDETT